MLLLFERANVQSVIKKKVIKNFLKFITFPWSKNQIYLSFLVLSNNNEQFDFKEKEVIKWHNIGYFSKVKLLINTYIYDISSFFLRKRAKKDFGFFFFLFMKFPLCINWV